MNLRDLLLFIGFLGSGFSCTTPPPITKVQPSIEEAKMILILKDIHLAEAATQSRKTTEKDSLLTLYYEQIYRIHETSKAEVEANIEAWFSDATQADELYAKVFTSLKIDQSNYEVTDTAKVEVKQPKAFEKRGR